jgi:hypothetical protein
MAVSFDHSTPVLFFDPNSYPLDQMRKREERTDESNGNQNPQKAPDQNKQFYFLWPAFSRQVLVHRGVDKKFNLFQSHVFRLCQAGVRSPESIADMLMFADEKEGNSGAVQLARRVFNELESMGIITNAGVPTASGIAMFEEDTARISEPCVITIFQDPWSGDVWNRISEKPPLPIVEPKNYGQEYFRVQVGSTGKSRIERAYVVRPTGITDCKLPKAEDVFSAHKQFYNESRSLAMKKGKNPDELDVSSEIVSISNFGPEEPVFLVTYAVCLGREFEGESWDVADPFGFGVSRSFLRNVRKVMAMPPMKRFATRLKEELPAETSVPKSSPGRVWNKAEQLVRDQFPKVFAEKAGLFEMAINLQMCVSQIRPDSRNQDEDWKKPTFSALRESIAIITGILDAIKEDYSTTGCYWGEGFTESDSQKNANKLGRIANQLGYTIDIAGNNPLSLFNLSLRQIISAADIPRSVESVGAKLAVNLIAAGRDTDRKNPLCTAAKLHPLLIDDICRLCSQIEQTDLSNIANTFNTHSAEEIKQTIFKLVRVLLFPDFFKQNPGQDGSDWRKA